MVRNLIGVKPNERVVKCNWVNLSGSEVSTSVVKWSKYISNRVSIIIRSYINHIRFVAYMVVPFITFLYTFCSISYHCTYGCMFCILLYSMYSDCNVYVFSYLCMFRFGYSVSFVVLCIVCV